MPTMPVPDDSSALSRWRAALARIADPHPFLAPEWQRAWWEHLGSGELTILPLGDDGWLVAAAASGQLPVDLLDGQQVDPQGPDSGHDGV